MHAVVCVCVCCVSGFVSVSVSMYFCRLCSLMRVVEQWTWHLAGTSCSPVAETRRGHSVLMPDATRKRSTAVTKNTQMRYSPCGFCFPLNLTERSHAGAAVAVSPGGKKRRRAVDSVEGQREKGAAAPLKMPAIHIGVVRSLSCTGGRPRDAGRKLLCGTLFMSWLACWPGSAFCLRLCKQRDGNWAFSWAERCNWTSRC